MPALFLEDFQGCQGRHGVAHLMLPHKGHQQRLHPIQQQGTVNRALLLPNHRERRQTEVRLPLPGRLPEHLFRLGLLVGITDHRTARLDDPGLFKGNLLHRISQHRSVVQGNGSDHRHLRHVNDVGGVEPASQAHFQHHNVALPLGKPAEGQGRDEFKFRDILPGGFQALGGICHPLHLLDELLFGNHGPVDLETLPELQHIGGGVQAGAVPRSLQGPG